MTSIIRSAKLSSNKHTLRRRGSDAAKEPVQTTTEPASPPGTPEPITPAVKQTPADFPGSDPQQLQALFEKARQSVLEQFKAEAEAARELGRQRGLQEGRQAAQDDVRRMVASDLERLHSIMGRLEASLDAGIEDLEEIALAIAFEALCKILGAAAVSEELMRAQIRHAASQMKKQEQLQVRLHPTDLAMLKDMGGLNAILPSRKKVSWVADPSIELGGCILETDGGQVDARFETQLNRLKQTLLDARAKAKD